MRGGGTQGRHVATLPLFSCDVAIVLLMKIIKDKVSILNPNEDSHKKYTDIIATRE